MISAPFVQTTSEPRGGSSLQPSTVRTDIQALRAFAVLAVLLFHLWPNRVTGGYVGVDIFFVISGYLITAHLVRELQTTGRIRAGQFWARRARRLLPASLLVLFATAMAVVVWVPRSLWSQFFGEITAATLYVENWRLAADSVDYLASTNQASPVQHFWTLSVEEQFYIALPLLLIAATRLLPRAHLLRTVLVVIALCTAASLVYGIWYTSWSPSASYFSTFTRAWEFGAGALLAFIPAIRQRFAFTLTAIGLAAAAVSTMLFTASTPFPGFAAALPVLGTAMIIVAGRHTFIARIGRLTPVAFLGRVSYSTYLIHWPPIVILPLVTGHALTTFEKLGILICTIIAAWLCTDYIEDPVRFSTRLLGKRRPRTVAIWAATGMALVLALCGVSLAVLNAESRAAAAEAAEMVADPPNCFGAQSLDPALAPCVNGALGAALVPAPADALQDDANRSECWAGATDAEFRVCSLGPSVGYAKHLLAIGDSHNNTLIGAYEQLAESYNWRIDVAGHSGCYWTAAELRLDTPETTTACASWQDEANAYLDTIVGLDAIVATRYSGGVDASQETVDGMASVWSSRPDQSTKIIAIVDNPRLPKDTIACVEREQAQAASRCTTSREDAIFDDGQVRAVTSVPGAHAIDLTHFYCTDEVCPPVLGGVLVYRDGSHLTATFASTIAPYLGREIRSILD